MREACPQPLFVAESGAAPKGERDVEEHRDVREHDNLDVRVCALVDFLLEGDSGGPGDLKACFLRCHIAESLQVGTQGAFPLHRLGLFDWVQGVGYHVCDHHSLRIYKLLLSILIRRHSAKDHLGRQGLLEIRKAVDWLLGAAGQVTGPGVRVVGRKVVAEPSHDRLHNTETVRASGLETNVVKGEPTGRGAQVPDVALDVRPVLEVFP